MLVLSVYMFKFLVFFISRDLRYRSPFHGMSLVGGKVSQLRRILKLSESCFAGWHSCCKRWKQMTRDKLMSSGRPATFRSEDKFFRLLCKALPWTLPGRPSTSHNYPSIIHNHLFLFRITGSCWSASCPIPGVKSRGTFWTGLHRGTQIQITTHTPTGNLDNLT